MKKLRFPERLWISTGLLLVTVPFLVNDWVHVPDFIRGGLMGLGIGMEIMGMIKLKKRQKADASC
jgi:hypothetical protein